MGYVFAIVACVISYIFGYAMGLIFANRERKDSKDSFDTVEEVMRREG